MRARTFRVPFSRVAPDAVELEWGPDDYVVVRPLHSKSPAELAVISARVAEVTAGEKKDEEVSEEDLAARRELLLDVLREVVVEWHLATDDGPVPMPTTWADIDALPRGLGDALFGFMWTYRGDGPDPTTAGAPS